MLLDLDLVRETGRDAACLCLASQQTIAESAQRPEAFLHPEELAYLRSLTAEKRKREFTLGRHAAKQALARLDGALLGPQVHIRPGVFGQPVVTPSGALPLSVCITHSGSFAAAVAFPGGHPIGIDLEQIDPAQIEALKSQISEEELPQSLGEISQAERYARVWTVKEALSKILRCGLTTPFSVLALAGDPVLDGPAFSGQFRNFEQYRFLSLATSRMVFAIVYPRRTEAVFCTESALSFLAGSH